MEELLLTVRIEHIPLVRYRVVFTRCTYLGTNVVVHNRGINVYTPFLRGGCNYYNTQ